MTVAQQSLEPVRGTQDDIEIRLGANRTHLPLVRAVAFDIALGADFDLEEISDIELAVDEACSWLISQAVAGSLLSCRFSLGVDSFGADSLAVTATVTTAAEVTPGPATWGWHLLTTLTDAVISWADRVDTGSHHVHIEFVKLAYP